MSDTPKLRTFGITPAEFILKGIDLEFNENDSIRTDRNDMG